MRVVAVLSVLLFSLAGLWAATAYVAAELRDVHRLGPPWWTLGTLRIDAPWAWIGWSRTYEPRYPLVFRNASGMTTLGAICGAAVGILGSVFRGRPSSVSRAHGSSRWATTEEVRKAGLLRDAGVVLCQTSDATFRTRVDASGQPGTRAGKLGTLIRHDGPEHVFCFAPTRSGKGVGLVVPTLLSWPHSVLVYDIKKENWATTAGWRRQFSRVWRFEPTSPDSVRFNPLLEIRRGLSEVRDVQNVADMLVDPTGEKDTKDHWQMTAHSLLCGAILHVLYAEPDKTLSGVAAFLADPSRAQRQTLEQMLSTPHLPTGSHPAVAQVAREMLNKSDNELSGVYSTAMAALGLYRDPVIARSTSESDFRIADLVGAATPVSLYLVVPPSDLTRTRPIIRLLLNQIGRRLTESIPGSKTQRLLASARRVPVARAPRLLRVVARVHRGLRAQGLPHRAVAQPARKGVRPEQRDSRQLPRARDLRVQRRPDRPTHLGSPRPGDREEDAEELFGLGPLALEPDRERAGIREAPFDGGGGHAATGR